MSVKTLEQIATEHAQNTLMAEWNDRLGAKTDWRYDIEVARLQLTANAALLGVGR